MLHRRHGHDGCIQLQVRLQQIVDRREHLDPVLLCGLVRPRRIRIDGRHKRHRLSFGLQLAHHSQMIAPKRSGAGHCHAQLSFASYFSASFSGFIAWFQPAEI